MAVWALPYGYNMGQPIEACQPDRVIAEFFSADGLICLADFPCQSSTKSIFIHID